ncbi:MAG: endonuclease MutS2, partial [Armatimonadetes bacterium]|nr:endonuclease MutS2 [Armatimonadota bacterium]
MDNHALRVLEFEQIREMLAACCACSLGKRRARALRPSQDAAWIADRLKETTEAREAVGKHGVPPFGGLRDVTELLRKATAGRLLEGEELLHVGDALRAARRVRHYFGATPEDEFRRLKAIAEGLQENRDLEERIEKSLDDEGKVRDDASDELRSLRRKQASA